MRPARRAGRARTLVVEPVYPVDARALVVAAQDEEVLRVLDLIREEQADRLEALLAAVDVVAEEEVVRVGATAADAEEFGEVVLQVARESCQPGTEGGADGIAQIGHGYLHR